MYLLRDRNATYYCRIPLPKNLRDRGFPHCIRTSLHTKDRAVATERNLLTAFRLKSLIRDAETLLVVEQWRSQVEAVLAQLRATQFQESLVAVPPAPPKKTKPTKPASSRPKQPLVGLLKKFIAAKRDDAISVRSIDQLQQRVMHFITFVEATTLPRDVSPRQALDYRANCRSHARGQSGVLML